MCSACRRLEPESEMKPMATKRRRKLHPQIIQEHNHKQWPVLDEEQCQLAARSKLPQHSDPHEALIQHYERVMSK